MNIKIECLGVNSSALNFFKTKKKSLLTNIYVYISIFTFERQNTIERQITVVEIRIEQRANESYFQRKIYINTYYEKNIYLCFSFFLFFLKIFGFHFWTF